MAGRKKQFKKATDTMLKKPSSAEVNPSVKTRNTKYMLEALKVFEFNGRQKLDLIPEKCKHCDGFVDRYWSIHDGVRLDLGTRGINGTPLEVHEYYNPEDPSEVLYSPHCQQQKVNKALLGIVSRINNGTYKGGR
jgi:hypothetical protein